MGNRKTEAYKDRVVARIKTTKLINRLCEHALASHEVMTPSQIAAAKVLLAKTVPDLKSVEVARGDDARSPHSLSAAALARVIEGEAVARPAIPELGYTNETSGIAIRESGVGVEVDGGVASPDSVTPLQHTIDETNLSTGAPARPHTKNATNLSTDSEDTPTAVEAAKKNFSPHELLALKLAQQDYDYAKAKGRDEAWCQERYDRCYDVMMRSPPAPEGYEYAYLSCTGKCMVLKKVE